MEVGKQEKKKSRVDLWGTNSVLRARDSGCESQNAMVPPTKSDAVLSLVGRWIVTRRRKARVIRHKLGSWVKCFVDCQPPTPGHAWHVAPRLPCCHATPIIHRLACRGPVSTPGTATAGSAGRRPYFFGCACACVYVDVFVLVFVLVRACAFVRRVMRHWTVCGSLDILRTTGGFARDDGWVDPCDRRARSGETAQRARRVS